MATLTFDVLYRDRGAERGMKNLGDQTERTGKRFSGLKVAGAAALLAVGTAAVKFGGQSVRAYVEAEASQIRLQDAFRKFPKLADTNIGALNKLNTELAKKTRFDDDATASGQAVLAQFKLTGQQITQLTPLLQDYAAKTGKDLPTAARDLGKAMLGQGRSLKAVGIDFKDTGTQSGNLDQIMRGLRSQVGGFAEKEGKSAGGRAAILKNQFGELQESAGKQLLPALMKAGDGLMRFFGFIEDNAPIFKSFKTIASAAFDALTISVGKGKLSFKTFGDYVSTHQADIIGVFVKAGKFAIEFGKGLTWMAIGGLRAIGTLDAGVGRFISEFITHTGKIVGAAARAFGWIPGIGPKLRAADVHFQMWAAGAKKGFESQGKGAKAAADKLENQLIPALDKSGRKFDEIGRKEIWKAQQRDAAAKASIAIRDIGKAGDAAKNKLHGYNIESGKGSAAQLTFASRVKDSRKKLIEKYQAYADAGVKGKAFAKVVKQSEDALYREFKQMGFSKEEARKLAKKYSEVPKKIETKTSAPGAVKAKREVEGVDKAIENTRGKSVTVGITVSTGLNKITTAFIREYGSKAIRKVVLARGGPVPGRSPSDSADDVPAMLTSGEYVHRRKAAQFYGGSAMRAINDMRVPKSALQRYASGGPVNLIARHRYRGETYDYEAIRDYAGKEAAATGRAAARSAGSAASKAAVAAAMKAARAAKSAAAAASASSSVSSSQGRIDVGRGWGPIMRAMRRHGASNFTTYSGHHPSRARARDVTPHNWKMANAAKALSSVWYVIYRMRIASKNRGNGWRQYHPISNRGDWRHNHHIHVARYDQGGDLPPGLTLAVNGTGRSERVTPMRRGGGAGRAAAPQLHFHFDRYVGNRNDLIREITDLAYQGKLTQAVKLAS